MLRKFCNPVFSDAHGQSWVQRAMRMYICVWFKGIGMMNMDIRLHQFQTRGATGCTYAYGFKGMDMMDMSMDMGVYFRNRDQHVFSIARGDDKYMSSFLDGRGIHVWM